MTTPTEQPEKHTMSDNAIEFTSRYDVFRPPNGCKSDCEGTGFIPHFEQCEASDAADAASAAKGRAIVRLSRREDEPPIYRVLWYLAEAKHATDDGWHFIPCPQCKPDDPLVKIARRFMGGGA